MNNNQLYQAISEPRFYRYLNACDKNKGEALKLYRANIILSEKMYSIIGIFEVVLRNSIDKHFLDKKGNEWLLYATENGGYLDISIGCEDSFHSVQEAIQKLGVDYTHDRLISKLSFGFWTYQFATKEFAASGSSLLNIFPNRPFGINQKKIFQTLTKINIIRNRIAHYEPICFDNKTGIISGNLALKRYEQIKEIINWLGYDANKFLYGIDGVNKIASKINKSS